MGHSTYFYLEPYVYIASGKNGILLINMLDDNTLIFNDSRSVDIMQRLLSSPKRTVHISEQDKTIPLISDTLKYFMGDLISSNIQPLQFESEINNISGIDAYHKSIIYSKYNIGSFISNCTLLVDMNKSDCSEYIAIQSGLSSCAESFQKRYPYAMNKSTIKTYIQGLVSINPNIVVNICGLDIDFLNDIIESFNARNLNIIISATTFNASPEILNTLINTNLSFSVLLNLPIDQINLPSNRNHISILTKITDKNDLEVYLNLLDSDYKVKFFPHLTSENLDFIKSLLNISEDELLGIPQKYQTIKINNLINSNLWGTIYLFSNGNIHYSLINDSNKIITFNNLYDGYKEDLINGTIDWIFNRNYTECKKCMYQRLCPPPNYIEHYLRCNNTLRCLIQDS